MKHSEEWDFGAVVDQWYDPLYRFAFGLSNESEAEDLTQETFRVFFEKSWQIRDPSKVKSWLFTTLYRRFLHGVSQKHKWPESDIDSVEFLPDKGRLDAGRQFDGVIVMDAVLSLDERFRGPVVLFYLRDFSYKEIAEILDIKIGTVMSRLARAKGILRRTLEAECIV